MKKKQDILETAERLFYASGFHAINTDRICSEARVSTRTFYRYFPSREALTAAVMDARETRFFSALHASDHPQAIPRLFEVLASWTRANGAAGCFFLKVWGEYAEEDQQLATKAMNHRHRVRSYIADCLNPPAAGSAPTLADAIWLLYEGAITASLVDGPTAADTAKQVALQLLCRPAEAP